MDIKATTQQGRTPAVSSSSKILTNHERSRQAPGVVTLLVNAANAVALDPAYFWLVGGALLVLETVLCTLIIRKVSYTNIDWDAYMEEVGGFLAGELDYAKLEGDTGPLVYPAGFVYIYSALSSITAGGKDVRLAQYLFAGLYVGTLAIVMAIYRRSVLVNRPYVLVFLTLSKRLHSIYVLRLFNDPVAMLPLYLCVLAMLSQRWRAATVLYSIALSVKMNILLFAPGFALLMYQALGLRRCIRNAGAALLLQIALAVPFLAEHPLSYLSRSFDFGRAFFYQWTVNWRFVDEKTFASKDFARLLLGAHAVLLFAFCVKWCQRTGGVGATIASGWRRRSPQPLAPDYVISVMFTCNLIGILCARSLHYQFWSWYAHSIPYLVWRAFNAPSASSAFSFSGCLRLGVKISVLAALEYGWNVYPSTSLSSLILFFCHAMVVARCLMASSAPLLITTLETEIRRVKKTL